MRCEATLAIDARDTIGEAPTWDARAARLLWSDNPSGIIHEARADERGRWHESKRWNLERPIGAAVPRACGGLMVASGVEILTLQNDGALDVFCVLDIDPTLLRINDAKCDPQGRLWAGTLATDFADGRGALYRIDPNGRVSCVLDGVSLSNGLDWSPDGRTFYYIDSRAGSVDAFDFDADSGAIGNRRSIVRFAWGGGAPDGMTVDVEGCLWVAVMATGEVRRFAPSGELLGCAVLSALSATSCAFGGRDGEALFITSAALPLPEILLKYGLSEDMLAHAHLAPGAGGLFVCRPGVRGKPATPFSG